MEHTNKSPFGNCVPLNPINPFGKEGMDELMCDIESLWIDITSKSSKMSEIGCLHPPMMAISENGRK